jgi:proteic killer suppression protein
MITSFACADTEALFHGRRVARFVNIERAAIRKLQMLDAADDLSFLRSLPGNGLKPLRGDRAGQYSLRINL